MRVTQIPKRIDYTSEQGSLKGPRNYLARVSKEVKFHFRSTEFPQ